MRGEDYLMHTKGRKSLFFASFCFSFSLSSSKLANYPVMEREMQGPIFSEGAKCARAHPGCTCSWRESGGLIADELFLERQTGRQEI